MKVLILNTDDFLRDYDLIEEAINEEIDLSTTLGVTGWIVPELLNEIKKMGLEKCIYLGISKLDQDEAVFFSSLVAASKNMHSFQLIDIYQKTKLIIERDEYFSLYGGFWRLYKICFRSNTFLIEDENIAQLLVCLRNIPIRFNVLIKSELIFIKRMLSLYSDLYLNHNNVGDRDVISNNSFNLKLTRPIKIKAEITSLRSDIKKSNFKEEFDKNLIDFQQVIDSLCMQKNTYVDSNCMNALILTYIFYSQYFLMKSNIYRVSKNESEVLQCLIRSFECYATVELLYSNENEFITYEKDRIRVKGKGLSGAGAFLSHLNLNGNENLVKTMCDFRNKSVLGHGFISILPDFKTEYNKLIREIDFNFMESKRLSDVLLQFKRGITPIDKYRIDVYLVKKALKLN